MRRKWTIVISLILLGAIVALLLKSTYDGLEREKSRVVADRVVSSVRVGMQRDETIRFTQEAWRHYYCDYGSWTQDVYLFGNRDPSLASIIILRFMRQGNKEILDKISGYESEFLHEFADCQMSEK